MSDFFNGIMGRHLTDIMDSEKRTREEFKEAVSPERRAVVSRCDTCDHNIPCPFIGAGDPKEEGRIIPYKCVIMGTVLGTGECTAYTPMSEYTKGPCRTCRWRNSEIFTMPDGKHFVRCSKGFPMDTWERGHEEGRFYDG